MHSPPISPLHRERFLRISDHPAETAWANAVLRLLIGQDGSTTRLLETMAGDRISVQLIEQGVVHELPRQLADSLGGEAFVRRVTSLNANGQVLLDSLSYIAIDVLPQSVVQELLEGVSPIGHTLSGLWTRRAFRSQDTDLFEELWRAVGCPDPQASRSTCIHTPHGPCMILGETFRRGVLGLLAPPAAA